MASRMVRIHRGRRSICSRKNVSFPVLAKRRRVLELRRSTSPPAKRLKCPKLEVHHNPEENSSSPAQRFQRMENCITMKNSTAIMPRRMVRIHRRIRSINSRNNASSPVLAKRTRVLDLRRSTAPPAKRLKCPKLEVQDNLEGSSSSPAQRVIPYNDCHGSNCPCKYCREVFEYSQYLIRVKNEQGVCLMSVDVIDDTQSTRLDVIVDDAESMSLDVLVDDIQSTRADVIVDEAQSMILDVVVDDDEASSDDMNIDIADGEVRSRSFDVRDDDPRSMCMDVDEEGYSDFGDHR